jgi:MurNAc alpha-1-phosphate uridylyltransferase
LETAGGIKQALPLLGEEPFVVLNADVWSDYNIKRLLNGMTFKTGVLAHLVLVPNAEHHPRGDFYLDNNGCVSDQGEPRLTFSGISVLHPLLFSGLTVQRLPLSPVLRQAMTRQQVSGEYFAGDWQDIGSPERLKALECRLLNPQPAT